MRKITKFLALAAIAALPFAFTSCDDDDYWYDDYGDGPWWYRYDDGGYSWNDNDYNRGDNNDQLTIVDEAQVLNGEWRGQMIYRSSDQANPDQFNADMIFTQNSTKSTKGTGTEYDYYLNQDGSIAADTLLRFNWYIEDNGDIYVKYGSGATFVMDIDADTHGFTLDEDKGVFYGYMIGTNNNDLIQFDFNRVTSNAKANPTRALLDLTTTKFGSERAPRITSTPAVMSLPKNR